jgi:hypothetical protein
MALLTPWWSLPRFVNIYLKVSDQIDVLPSLWSHHGAVTGLPLQQKRPVTGLVLASSFLIGQVASVYVMRDVLEGTLDGLPDLFGVLRYYRFQCVVENSLIANLADVWLQFLIGQLAKNCYNLRLFHWASGIARLHAVQAVPSFRQRRS